MENNNSMAPVLLHHEQGNSHIQTVDDNVKVKKKGPHKKYLEPGNDHLPVPRRTQYRHETQAEDDAPIQMEVDLSSSSSSDSYREDTDYADTSTTDSIDEMDLSQENSPLQTSTSDEDQRLTLTDYFQSNNKGLDDLHSEDSEDDSSAYQLQQTESAMLIMAHVLRFKCSDVELASLLEIADLHHPYPIHRSNFIFFKNFRVNNNAQKHYFCSECDEMIQIIEDKYTMCEFCKTDFTKKALDHDSSYFLYLPLKPQLETLVMSDVFLTSRQEEDTHSDVINGSHYKTLCDSGIIGENDISIQWNTDGVKLFNRGEKSSIWPIQVVINELPYVIRKNNVLLCGLWFHKKKPNMNLFSHPFIEELVELHEEGFQSKTIFSEEPICIKVHTILASLDSMARPPVQNMKQFNGEYGCSYCFNPGKQVRGSGGKRIDPGDDYPLRTKELHLTHVNEANQTGECVKGVYGPSEVMRLNNFSVVEDIPPDYMHAVLEGTMKSFFGAWLDPSNHHEPWYLGTHRTAIDKIISKTTPPCEITRVLRSVTTYKNWTASEWRNFLLYYSLPILKKFMSRRYYKHFFLFVLSIDLLDQEYVSEDNRSKAERSLRIFVAKVPTLYNENFMKYNLHLLLHIPYYVKRFGALWSWSNFPFETYNGVIKQLFNGFQYVPDQILKSYRRLQIVKDYGSIFDHPEANVDAQKHFQYLTRQCHVDYYREIGDSLETFGAPIHRTLDCIEKIIVENACQIHLPTNNVTMYSRFAINNLKFHSLDYSRLTVRNNSIAKLVDNTYVQIHGLIDLTKTNGSYFILCYKYNVIGGAICEHEGSKSDTICTRIKLSDSLICHPVSLLEKKCFAIPYDDEYVLFPLVNHLERD